MSAPVNNTVLIAKDYRARLVATDSAVEPQLESCVVVPVPDAATGDIDVVLASAFEVTDVVVQKRGSAGGAANTITVKAGSNAITDAISINVSDQVLARAGTVNDAYSTLARGDTLRVTRTKAGGNAACLVIIRGLMR